MSTIAVIAVHPDDETLGCGGTLLRHKTNGDTIHWIICTTLDAQHPYYKKRQEEIAAVTNAYDFDGVHHLKLKTMQVDEYSMSELVGAVSSLFQSIKPDTIYLPFAHDVHSDHRKIFEAAYACTKSFRYPFIKKIYMMETLSETEFASSSNSSSFIPNIFVNITPYLKQKCDIMKIYTSEIAPAPFPRSLENIKALAQLRGASCGYTYAESFMLLKEIQD